ncbi:Polyamine transporter 4 [Cyphellophora attinorum]|uniref:Polyamine transporter 4 n=1 Tax=Cyphellophora attinorum TaxID=1664694 RepID=A0A0N1NVE6_9EURO|nr:Polyamine transporter 4 [Phialophora attinorum]KPI34565.1 Polyamine transporter 4 [Phialophora attinorum]
MSAVTLSDIPKEDSPQQRDVSVKTDPQSPHDWSAGKKAFFSLGIVLSSFTPSFGNSAYVASIYGVQDEFQVSINMSLLGISLYAIGFAVGPALGSTASELWGRSWITKGSLLLCLIFTVVSGSATTFRTMIVGRTLAGITGSASITPLIGICNDLYSKEQHAKHDTLVSLYGIAMVWAAILGPTAAEAVVTSHNDDWRWSFWLLAILLGISFAVLLPLPETYKAELRQDSANRLDRQGQSNLTILFKIGLGRPLRMLAVELVVLPCALVVAVCQTIFFSLYVALPVQLQREHGFSNYQIGLSFLAIFIGSVIGLVILRVCDIKLAQPKLTQRLTEVNEGRLVSPRERLTGPLIGGILQVISLFWLAWTCRKDIHWVVPLLALIPYGISWALLMLGMPVYKNAIYMAQYGASALAPDLILRYVMSSFFPLFTPQMLDAMTFEWTVSFFAFLSIPMAVLPLALYRYGDAMLQRSVYLKRQGEDI